MFLVNNLLLAVYGFVVLIGTTYPLLVEAFTGTQVGVGAPFFNRLAVPLSFALLLVMGFGPVTPWRGAPPGLLWKRLRWPTLLALAVGVATAAFVTRVGWVVLATVLGTFVASAIVGLLIEMTTARTFKTERPFLTEMRTVVRGDQPFWAGQLSHLGVVLVAIGIAFASNLASHATVDLEPGDTVDFAGYTITYETPFRRVEPNRVVEGAQLLVTRDDRVVGRLEPRVNLYGPDSFAVFTPAVMSKPSGDLYVTLRGLDSTQVNLTLDTSPMVWMLWLGGLTAAAGGVWSLSARRRDRATAPEPQGADV
jgi:cytochrome c-type biogenesis protein CcmF